MPPRSTRSQTRSGAGPPLPPPLPPPPPPPQTAAVPVAPASTDLSFDFMAKVPSPVTLPSSQQALGTASSALSALSAMSGTSAMSAAQLAAAPTPSSRDNPYDFLAMVPSPVTLLPLQPTRSAAATPSAPSAPPAAAASRAPRRSAAAPTLSSGNDPYDFIAKIPSPVTLPSSQPARSAAAAPPTPTAPPAVPPATPTSAPPQSVAMPPPTTRTRSGAGSSHPPLVPSAPPALSQSTLPTSLGGGDAAIGLMANVPSQVMLPLSQSGQGSRAVRLSSITVISILTSHWTTYRLCLLIQSTLTTLKGSLCRTHRHRYVFQYFLIIKLMSHIQIGF